MPKQIFDNDEPLLDYDAIDDLAAMGIGDRGYTDVNPPIGSDEMFGDQFERRAREIQRTPSGMQAVHVVPMKSGPWSANNQLGTQVDFNPSAATRNTEQTLLKLDEWGFPEVWSLMLGMTYSDDTWGASAGAAFNIIAKIRAGVGGVTQELEVDWIQGTTLSLPMNALNVIGEFTASTDTPTDLRVQLSLAKGKVNGRPPQRSFQLAGLAPGGGTATSNTIRIPNFTKSVMVVDRAVVTAANSVFSANFTLRFHPQAAATSTVGAVTGDQLIQFASNGFPIPTFARYVTLQASNPAVAVLPDLIFFLAL